MDKNKKNKSFEVYYNGELLFNNAFMTEIPYKIVQNYMELKKDTLSFDEFRIQFNCIKEIISKKGSTQFILEEEQIGDEHDTSNIRPSNYLNTVREILTYRNNNEEVRFGVWTQWKYENENSNFSKFIDNIKSLGYVIVEKINSEEKTGDNIKMSSIEYTKLKSVIQKIVEDQNIKISDLGCTEGQFNNDKIPCFDMALIKKLEGSNVASKGGVSSNQSSILITGEAQNIFPCIRRAEFADKTIGKNIIIKSKVRLMQNNYIYLNSNEPYEKVENKVVVSFITTNETTQNRVELGCKSIDGKGYVQFYESLSNGDYIFILKLAAKLEYVILGIKSNDKEKYFSELGSNIDVITFFDKISKVTVNSKEKITYIDSTQYENKRATGGKNKIYFGAPGTGKSKYVDDKYNDGYAMRVTFHPEYTYNDFVGYIRPIVDGKDLTYKFVPGIFTEILVEALIDPFNMYTLIIEELNRANTASVFGDLFQLMDRTDDGSSEYRVNNTEIYKYIKDVIRDHYTYNDGSIGIPSNLNIIATMNTADQNVFVMDTAFKRRWGFEYIPVEFKDNHKFKDSRVTKIDVTWKQFVEAINEFMMSEENKDLFISEDKQIGPYFVKENELNDTSKFGYKVLLYLWDDVFKMDKYKLFNKEIRTFSKLISEFSGNQSINIFSSNFIKKLEEKKIKNENTTGEPQDKLKDGQNDA